MGYLGDAWNWTKDKASTAYAVGNPIGYGLDKAGLGPGAAVGGLSSGQYSIPGAPAGTNSLTGISSSQQDQLKALGPKIDAQVALSNATSQQYQQQGAAFSNATPQAAAQLANLPR